MATWMGNSFFFSIDAVDFDEMPYCRWKYYNTSDRLEITFTYPEGRDAYVGTKVEAREETIGYDPGEGEALLQSLLDWDKRYNDGVVLKKFLSLEKRKVMKSDLNLKALPRSAILKHMPLYERKVIGFLFMDQDFRLDAPVWRKIDEVQDSV